MNNSPQFSAISDFFSTGNLSPITPTYDYWQEEYIRKIWPSTSRVDLIKTTPTGSLFKVVIRWPNATTIAVKVIKQLTCTSSREGNVTLDHPNIVQTLKGFTPTDFMHRDVDLNKTEQYLISAFEFFPKGSLETYCGNLTEKMVWQVLQQVSSALLFMYNNGQFIHRNIRPESIMVRKIDVKSETIQVAISNFDMVRSERTLKTLIPGEDSCVEAPENGLGVYTSASDVYSLGVTLFKAMFGLKQNPTKSNASILFSQKGVSQEFICILGKMIQQDPNHRFPWQKIIDFCNLVPASNAICLVSQICQGKQLTRGETVKTLCTVHENTYHHMVYNGDDYVPVVLCGFACKGSVVVASKNFVAKHDDELTMQCGTKLMVLEVSNDGWMKCKKENEETGNVFWDLVEPLSL